MKMIIRMTVILAGLLFTAVVAQAQRTGAEHLARCEQSSEKGDLAKAIEHCSKAIAVEPTLEDAYILRASLYKRRGDLDAAIADQTKLIELTQGMTMFLVYRAELYLMQNKTDAALADLNMAIDKRPDGLFGARAYFYRGTINEARNMIAEAVADYEMAIRLRPHYTEASERLARIRPRLPSPPVSPTPPAVVPTPPAVVPTPTPKPVPVANNWNRMVLTGTGLSVESPMPFVLTQDKPDPLSETQTANVFWTMSHAGIFATIRYLKSTDGKTPRQSLEYTAKIFAESNNNPIAPVADVSFMGEPAVQFEEEFTDVYDPAKPRKKRRVVGFGSAGEVTTIQINYPASDAAAASMSEQIFRSFQKQGEQIAETPRMPPANWQFVRFHGLELEVPSLTVAPKCGLNIPDPLLIESDKVCYEWDKSPIVRIDYEMYKPTVAVPSAAALAQKMMTLRKELKGESKLDTIEEYSTEPFTVAGADAVKLKIYTGYGIAGTREEIMFIKLANEVWTVRTYEFMRFKYTADAVKRIAASIRF